jgi:hypothetical protein
VTDNKRAADDAEREAFEALKYWPSMAPREVFSAGYRAALSSRADGGKDSSDALFNACMTREIDPTGTPKEVIDRIIDWEISLERADGGKGEAVAGYVIPQRLNSGDPVISLYRKPEGAARFPLYTAPQAECAPREAQPVGPRTTLNYDGTFDTTCAHCGGNGCFACLKSAAPTPERADADTAGAKPTCPHCGLTDIEFSRVCHNSACSGYAKEESFYRGWENTAAPASQERADAGKDAARYRWFRQGKLLWVTVPVRDKHVKYLLGHKPEAGFADALDQAIDAAILAADKEPT